MNFHRCLYLFLKHRRLDNLSLYSRFQLLLWHIFYYLRKYRIQLHQRLELPAVQPFFRKSHIYLQFLLSHIYRSNLHIFLLANRILHICFRSFLRCTILTPKIVGIKLPSLFIFFAILLHIYPP